MIWLSSPPTQTLGILSFKQSSSMLICPHSDDSIQPPPKWFAFAFVTCLLFISVQGRLNLNEVDHDSDNSSNPRCVHLRALQWSLLIFLSSPKKLPRSSQAVVRGKAIGETPTYVCLHAANLC